jgi:predicted secreted protein
LNKEYEGFKLNTVVLSNKIINIVHLDDIMAVELTESPSTGYCWYYGVVSDPSIIELEGKQSFDFNKPNIMGGSIQIVWKFKCLEYGECEIHFTYYNSWKKDSTPLDEFTYIVKIEK